MHESSGRTRRSEYIPEEFLLVHPLDYLLWDSQKHISGGTFVQEHETQPDVVV